MPDVLGYRKKFGVLVPSTNTVVEPDYYSMAPHGVTLHTARIYIEDPKTEDDAGFEYLMVQIRASLPQAVQGVMTCEPDYLIMGMSSETFWSGVRGNEQFEQKIRDLSGLPVATGAKACDRALRVLGARRISVLTPYQPIADAQVRLFFEECGYEIVAMKGLCCPTATTMADVDEATLRQVIIELDQPQVDAVVQCGTNLSMIRLADAAERWLGKPVIAINAATFWYALRETGITDQIRGFGCLLRDY